MFKKKQRATCLVFSILLRVLAAVKSAFGDLVEDGFPNWKQKIVFLASDGASVNLGVRSGVIELIKAEVGNHVIPFHCMAHR